jgi:large subunit ribosomal protein L6
MSRIGKLPINVPKAVEVQLNGINLKIKGPKGELQRDFHPSMKIEKDDSVLKVLRPNDEPKNKALHGLTRTLINNMVLGVSEGFSKTLSVIGVGYKVELKGKDLLLQLGYSHPVSYPAPNGIQFEVDSKQNLIIIKGVDKQKVGQVSAEIRSLRPPEPYKGKGVQYQNERVRRKAGKAAVGGK